MPYMVKDQSTAGSDRGGKIIQIYSKDEVNDAIVSEGSVPPPSSKGDIPFASSGTDYSGLEIGTEDQVLTVSDSGVPEWTDASGGTDDTLHFEDDFIGYIHGCVTTYPWTFDNSGTYAEPVGSDKGSWICLRATAGSDGCKLYFDDTCQYGWKKEEHFSMNIRIKTSTFPMSAEFDMGFHDDSDNVLGIGFRVGNSYVTMNDGSDTGGFGTNTSVAPSSDQTYIYRIAIEDDGVGGYKMVIYRGTTTSNLTEVGSRAITSSGLFAPWFKMLVPEEGATQSIFMDYVRIRADRCEPGSHHGGG